MESDTVPIKVLCRVRPLNAQEFELPFLPVLHNDRASISLLERHFTFDKVFGPEATQEEVYIDGVSAIVNDVLTGYNGTIFAYGQTASGKTHTMEGDMRASSCSQSGITPRIIADIFKHVGKLSSHIQANLKVSYFEVYMDRVKDLLDVSKVNLPVHEDKNKIPYVKGVTEIEVESMEQVFKILNLGKSNRSVSVTNMNEHSSRSHSIFSIQLRQVNVQSEKTLHGKLYLVDLAGSEKVSKSGAEGITLREAKKINKSLSALGNVISALSEGNKNHVPYRDSKLTRILQQSLGGNSRTSIFICCSPSVLNEAETRSSLMFGQRAKTIKNQIQVNEELTADEWRKRYEKEKEKTARLRTKLAQYEIAPGPPSDLSPDIIPKSLPSSAPQSPALTSHSSMPSLSAHQLTDMCQECLRYQHDISRLCQQLDDKDDELGERSRDILSLEHELANERQRMKALSQDNTVLIDEHKAIESKYINGQEEVRAIIAALEELTGTYQDMEVKHRLKTEECDVKCHQVSRLEEALAATEDELAKLKVKLDENKSRTVGMFLDLFNDFSHVTLNDKLKAAADIYKSTSGLNLPPTATPKQNLVLSASENSSLSSRLQSDSDSPNSATTSSLYSSQSVLDLSPTSPSKNLMTQSLCDLRLDTDTVTPTGYHGSQAFQERVGGLRDRLSLLLESNYRGVVTHPDSSSSYIRNIRQRRLKPNSGGRVFTVFSRAARKGKFGSADEILPMQLGRHF
ncbi:kinesin heavy chain-like [Watersipora subatra]|uniref:kinesin heavy chain-like n=1 Tax=Watersipora subatra TaxID=2589382 RepID=UPI00355C8CAE